MDLARLTAVPLLAPAGDKARSELYAQLSLIPFTRKLQIGDVKVKVPGQTSSIPPHCPLPASNLKTFDVFCKSTGASIGERTAGSLLFEFKMVCMMHDNI